MKKIIFMSAIVALAMTTMFTSCKPTEDDEKADKNALSELVSECQAILANATTADYPQASIDAFQEAVTTAQALVANADATQAQVDAMVANLTAARDAFLASAYDAIPQEALLVGLSFDEGTAATTSLTATGKGYVANVNPGIILASEKPEFIAGKIGKAVYFGGGGSNLSIDQFTASDFLGPKLSISVWVKPEVTKADNYFLSWNSWHTWKLQLQDANKPFMTVNTELGAADADNEAANSCPEGEWHHVVVSLDLTAHTLSFYVDGGLTKEWNADEKPPLAGSSIVAPTGNVAITIGGCYKTLLDAQTYDWDGFTLENYTNYFVGALDELKIYNIALTPGQVSKLYNEESAK
ncbi:MAG: FIVAR domain-containing protein [Bacteroidales bacterium]|jgi:hypothetical protein|nr:FIVAR domain-containing protein [Bacteroidales bacterium]